MKDLSGLMKQAQEMQRKMADAQSRLDDITVTGESGAGLVKIQMTAKGDIQSVAIDPACVDSAEVEVLEDLVSAAFNDAKRKADSAQRRIMAEAAQGLGLPPGIDLPFGSKPGPF